MEWEFSGKNVETAIKKALKELRLAKEDIEIKILDEGKAGLFGLMGSCPARIKVISSKKPDLVDWKLALERAKEYTLLIASAIDETVEVKTERKGRKIKISMTGKNRAGLIGKKGSTLKALNYIVELMMKKDPETRADIFIDSDGYRKQQVDNAINDFSNAAKKVKETGKSVELKPMEAVERKAIHRKSKQTPGITTTSIGENDSRRIVVKLKK
ncbi:MAG: KH domain-containing protein [Elusimicrobia bacterium]|nr:KH domain-containing protein [Elusimicrobiota bacterium]